MLEHVPPASSAPVGPQEELSEAVRALVGRVAEALEERGEHDPRRQADAASLALMAEAHLELRRALALVRTPLEHASGADDGDVRLDAEAAQRMLRTLDRITVLAETHLDRERVAALLIHLRPERFDLGMALEKRLAVRGIAPGEAGVDLSIAPCALVADPEKLVESLAHLVSRFWFAAGPASRLVVSVGPAPKGVAAFMGLSGAGPSFDELMSDLTTPFSLEGAELDMGYARAVIERHGGTITVERRLGALGFGIHLPAGP